MLSKVCGVFAGFVWAATELLFAAPMEAHDMQTRWWGTLVEFADVPHTLWTADVGACRTLLQTRLQESSDVSSKLQEVQVCFQRCARCLLDLSGRPKHHCLVSSFIGNTLDVLVRRPM